MHAGCVCHQQVLKLQCDKFKVSVIVTYVTFTAETTVLADVIKFGIQNGGVIIGSQVNMHKVLFPFHNFILSEINTVFFFLT